jgi:NAD(P)-dependent dehydrogenase (short-subunit alcohol dehydrogenase family)
MTIFMQQEKTAVVTGSSTGNGFETSLMLARNGFYTYATMRNVDKSEGIVDVARKDGLPLEVLQHLLKMLLIQYSENVEELM